MSEPVVWILACASAFLLISGGFTLAVARFRARVVARRRQAAKLGAQLEGKAADPFGELAVIGDQLRKIQQRLSQSEAVAGLPVQATAPSAAQNPQAGSPPVTAELEQDLDLFKKEVYSKTHRIDELMSEKQLLASKIVELEGALASTRTGPSSPRGGPQLGSVELVDVLQAEADELRAQIAERDQLFSNLQKSDTSGLMKEVGRIRQELLGRNEEVAALKARLAQSGPQDSRQTELDALEQEKEALAAKALESAGQLRKANERIAELEQSMVSHQAMAFSAAAQSPPQPPSPPRTGPPRVPMPRPDASAQTNPTRQITNPPQRSAGGPPPPPRPPSPGFPDEPTIKDPPPRITPPPQPKVPPPRPKAKAKGRPTGSIFPPPRGKKDLLD